MGAAEPRAVVQAPHHRGRDGPPPRAARGAGPESLRRRRVDARQAFDDLVAWIERGVRPDGEDVLAADLSRVGLKWTPYLHPEDPLAARR